MFVGCSVIVGHYDITMCCTPQKFTRLSDPFLFSSFKWYCKLLLITLLIKKELGAHLYNHGLRDKHDFKKYFKVSILEVCSPKILEVKEHLFIHRLNTLSPFGINLSNPFSIPLPVLFK